MQRWTVARIADPGCAPAAKSKGAHLLKTVRARSARVDLRVPKRDDGATEARAADAATPREGPTFLVDAPTAHRLTSSLPEDHGLTTSSINATIVA